MEYALLITGSVTKTNLFKKSIENKIPHISVVQTPTSIKSGGCSYSIRFRREFAGQIADLARSEGLKKINIYAESYNSLGQKEYIPI